MVSVLCLVYFWIKARVLSFLKAFISGGGDSPVLTLPRHYIFHNVSINSLASLCSSTTLPCVDFMNVIMGVGVYL